MKGLLFALLFPLVAMSQEAPVGHKVGGLWVIDYNMDAIANAVLDSADQDSLVFTSYEVLQTGATIIIVIRGEIGGKSVSDRVTVTSANDTLWTLWDAADMAYNSVCQVQQCCAGCAKYANGTCGCSIFSCQNGMCETRWVTAMPQYGLSNSIRYRILSY